MDDIDKTIPPKRTSAPDGDDVTMPGKRDRKPDGRFVVGDLIMSRYKVLAELGQGSPQGNVCGNAIFGSVAGHQQILAECVAGFGKIISHIN